MGVGWSWATMKAWFLLLLLLSFQTRVSCKKRRRCPTGLKMNKKGRCIKGYGATSTSDTETDFLDKLALDLKQVLGRDVLIPCTWEGYCEVCFKNDPGKVFCPRNEWTYSDTSDIVEYHNKSVYEDFSDWKCESRIAYTSRLGDASNASYSYWSGYDDGSICDCGAPFEFNREGNKASFFPVKPTDKKPGFFQGSSFVDESTGTMSWFHMSGATFNEQWESGEFSEDDKPPPGIWDSRPPTVAPESCSKYPDISSIFKFSYQRHFVDGIDYGDDGYKVIDKIEASHNRSCTLEDISLLSSENLEVEVRESEAGNHDWCESKCWENWQCDAWTFDMKIGYCALMKADQVKVTNWLDKHPGDKDKFMSGTKNNCLISEYEDPEEE